MELSPFDPADYLDSEEGVEAYLSDALTDGSEAYSRALEVVGRARVRMRRKLPVDLERLKTHAEGKYDGRVYASAGRSMMSGKRTSSRAATAAGKTLSNIATGSKSKAAAGSALSQKEPRDTKSTSSKSATAASKTLSEGRTATESKSSASSALSQRKKS